MVPLSILAEPVPLASWKDTTKHETSLRNQNMCKYIDSLDAQLTMIEDKRVNNQGHIHRITYSWFETG